MGLRAGLRTDGVWFFGAAYEFSKHDSSNLLQLPILQQVRLEARRYLTNGDRITPYIVGYLGASGYGDLWKLSTYAALLGFGVGLEYQATQRNLVGILLAYRAMYFSSWVDQVGQPRTGGLTHFLALELTIEGRTEFARAAPTKPGL